MRVIGVTGHVDVPDETASWVVETLTARLQEFVAPGWLGITCLAKGTARAQLFARAVLALNGSFEVVLPSVDYPQRMREAGDSRVFQELLALASHVRTMPYPASCRDGLHGRQRGHAGPLRPAAGGLGQRRRSRRVGDTADVVAWPPAPAGCRSRCCWPGNRFPGGHALHRNPAGGPATAAAAPDPG